MNANEQLDQFAATERWLNAEAAAFARLPFAKKTTPRNTRRWAELCARAAQLRREFKRFLETHGGASIA